MAFHFSLYLVTVDSSNFNIFFGYELFVSIWTLFITSLEFLLKCGFRGGRENKTCVFENNCYISFHRKYNLLNIYLKWNNIKNNKIECHSNQRWKMELC